MYKKVLRYETFIIVGFSIPFLSFFNVIGITNIPSDLFWTLAGLGLIVEGFIERIKWKNKKERLLHKDKQLMFNR